MSTYRSSGYSPILPLITLAVLICIAFAVLLLVTGQTPRLAVATATATKIPKVTSTVIPAAEPLPAPFAMTLTTDRGQSVHLPAAQMKGDCKVGGSRDAAVMGLPTIRGIEVAWKYVQGAEIGAHAEAMDGNPLRVTLVNGEIMETLLGEDGYWLFLTGDSETGMFEGRLSELSAITVKHTAAAQIPDSLPMVGDGLSATVTVDGLTFLVSNLSFEQYECQEMNDQEFTRNFKQQAAVPLESGLNVELAKVSELHLESPGDRTIQATVVTTDGQTIQSKLAIWDWRLTGKTRWGDFDLPIRLGMHKISLIFGGP